MPRDECAKCGQQVRFFRWKWEKKDAFPEFYGKSLCGGCLNELNVSAYQKKVIIELEQPFKEADEQGKRLVTIMILYYLRMA